MRGRPKGSTKVEIANRNQRILDIAREATSRRAQTVRHIYYLCSGQNVVGKDHGDETSNYDKVARVVQDARWEGRLAWNRIIDGSRELSQPIFWDDNRDFLQNVIPQFALDKWKGQPCRVVLAIEKDAIAAMLRPVCQELHVPFLPFRGDLSDTKVYELARHIAEWQCERVVCLYMGDFDPHGRVIDRAVFGNKFGETDEEREGKLRRMLRLFFPECDAVIEYRRIAVNQRDVRNRAFEDFILLASGTDTNYRKFLLENDGDDRTLGVDALDADELERRARVNIARQIDQTIWSAQEARYREQRRILERKVGKR
jgi:hypothetical protein